MPAFPGLPKLASRPRKAFGGKISRPRGLRMRTPRTLNYQRIKEEVEAAIAKLSTDDQWRIPAAGTLPERMVALALVQLGYLFESQSSELGGRMRLGGGVVDFKVYVAATVIVIRVQGDYWHSLPSRIHKDAVQWTRLHALGYRVADLWEHDIYQAWIDRRLTEYVAEAINGAA
jgi:G:T-mismatch repair DNA endonuclease (very short patch repair protein)